MNIIKLEKDKTPDKKSFSQEELKNMPDAKMFYPDKKQRLAFPKEARIAKGLTTNDKYEDIEIGVADTKWQTYKGKVFENAPAKEQRIEKEKDRFNSRLRAHGYNRYKGSDGETDGDHISELQMVGVEGDVLGNLWPLNSQINQRAGRVLSQSEFAVRDGIKKKFHQLEQRSYFFKIKKFDIGR